jgi:hypothetical protein
MGYWASSSWNIKFPSRKAIDDCRLDLALKVKDWDLSLDGFLANMGENTDEFWGGDDDLTLIEGTTDGKWFVDMAEVMEVIAKYAIGEVIFDCSDSGDGIFKYSLFGDGTVNVSSGRIVFEGEDEVFITIKGGKITGVENRHGHKIEATICDYDIQGVDPEDLIADKDGEYFWMRDV